MHPRVGVCGSLSQWPWFSLASSTQIIDFFRVKMSGHVGDLSRSQEEALRQFREAVSEIPNKPEEDDYYYLRWLRARKFNVRKAEEMFRKV